MNFRLRREIRELVRTCELLIGCLHHDGLTDEEYTAIATSFRELEKEIFLYRVEHSNLSP